MKRFSLASLGALALFFCLALPAHAAGSCYRSVNTWNAQLTSNSILDYSVCDASGNLNVNVAAGSISITGAAPLPGGTSTATAANQAIGIQAWDGTANLVPLKETSNALWVNVQNASLAVTGTFWQATQPISGAISFTAPQHVIVDSGGGGGSVTQGTSPWIVAGGGTAGVPGTAVLTVQGVGSGTPVPVSGTFWQTTQPVSLASLPALAAGSNIIGNVRIDQTTIGTTNGVTLVTTGSNALAVQPGMQGTFNPAAVYVLTVGHVPYISTSSTSTTLALASTANADGFTRSGGIPATTQSGGGPDAPVTCRQSVAMSALAANAQLVALTGGQSVYVCGFNFTANGTTPTVQFVYGTGSVCATGQAALTGAYAPLSSTPVSYGGGEGIVFKPTPVSQALCVLIGGTAPTVNGVVTYDKW